MVSPSFPVISIHSVAALSCCTWVLVTLLAHAITSIVWHGYTKLKYKHKLAWCNRIASATHATILVAGQMGNLSDPVLNADPLFGITDGHFFWGSIMYGYLIYDTLFTLMFYEAVGTVAFLLHHCLGLTCCCFGLYFNKMALFGTAIQVFFEGTTPLLHLMGCLKLMGREGTLSYTVTGMAFIAQFFVCRVVVANYYWSLMISAVAALDTKPAWAWGGIAVYGVLSGLNLFWFYKLMLLALQASTKQHPKPPTPALQPSPTAAAVTAITATSGQAVAAAADAASCVSTSVTKAKPLRQRSKQVLAEWLNSSKQKAAAVSGFTVAD